MSEIVNILPYSIDLKKTLEKTELHTLFVMGDNEAHRFELEILSGSKAADLTGCTVTGYFTNFKEDTTIMVDGKVEGGKAVVTLSKPCYTLHGQFVLLIQIKSGDPETTVFQGEGYMRSSKGETIIYDDYIVYDANALLAHIEAMRTATDNANAATSAANTATRAANTAAGNADAKAQAAQEAANAANAAAQNWSNGTAADSAKLGGKAPEYYLQPRNLLDNSDFEIAQAGYNGYHGNDQYCADRWYGNNLGALSVSGEVKTFTSVSGFAYMRQTLWNDGRDHGKTYTLVITLPDGTRLAASGTSPTTPSTSEHVFVELGAPDNRCWAMVMKTQGDAMCVRIDASQVGASISFVSIDLFEGAFTAESAPPHVPKGYANELLACEVAEKGNIFGMDLLWENASPSSVYPPQSVTCDLSRYSEIEVEFRHNYENNSSVFRKCQIGTTGFVEAMETYNSKLYIFTRQFRASGNTVEFLSGNMTLNDAVSNDNGRLVPVRIYGIKGVGA